ncbi:ileal sodium/bile acid cotransporter-like [Saccoglossus kowalevskii]|uniref:Ileal sodium/bile acid cotransporter-like n=1 Tax=Saccoglossus kowalevskii TaxID=10224 RepID=A0ABM0GN98_SACKO|nr:PREDICTED: ileal sodium/bile acid cotransporter-like [Saccoglossus kowalevskii]
MNDTTKTLSNDFSGMTEATIFSLNITMNGTDDESGGAEVMSDRVAGLRLANQILLTIISLSMMVGMGCAITFKELWCHTRRPWGVLIGIFCQYGILPLVSFALAHLLSLNPAYAIGMLVVACSPGGLASNLLTYWIEGDVSLSICMTTVSTFVAFGMMPLCLFIYSRSWANQDGVPSIPYMDIIIALVSIILPVVVGVFIRHKWEKKAGLVSRIGGILGLVGIVISLIIQGMMSTAPYRSPWQLWSAAFFMPIIGYSFSYLFAKICKLPVRQRRTIGIETGMQNVAVALTVMALSFRDAGPMVKVFPSIYTLVQSLFVLVTVPIAVLHKRVLSKYKIKISLVPREPKPSKEKINDKEAVDEEEPDNLKMESGSISISRGDMKGNYKIASSLDEFVIEDLKASKDLSESHV